MVEANTLKVVMEGIGKGFSYSSLFKMSASAAAANDDNDDYLLIK